MVKENDSLSSFPQGSWMGQQAFQQPKPEKKRWRPLLWWYHISTPDDEPQLFTSGLLPRSHLASILILIVLVASIAFLPAALTSDDLHVLPPVLGMFVVGCIAIPLNRRGNVTIVGILIVGALDFALAESLLSYPHWTLTQNAIPIYDLFVLSDIIAISLLPINSIFYVSFYHSVFMMADILLQPKAADLQLLVDQTTYSFMVRPLAIQIVVAVVTYLWVRNTMKALERANRAEALAQLEHSIALERKELEEGIQQLLYVLVEAANGNLNVRVPLAQHHVLWQVGVGLNTLLARCQRAQMNERELVYIKMEIRRLLACLHETQKKHQPLWLVPGGTELDLLIRELITYSSSIAEERPEQR